MNDCIYLSASILMKIFQNELLILLPKEYPNILIYYTSKHVCPIMFFLIDRGQKYELTYSKTIIRLLHKQFYELVIIIIPIIFRRTFWLSCNF